MMQEEKIFIQNDSLLIEALLHRTSGAQGTVICHPHSLMGGSMYNNVVEALQEAFAGEGVSTLRFNFRGVGGSTGNYDEGRGERRDILAVCNYLKHMGMSNIFFAGYSFGAWVGSKVIEDNDNPFSFSICVAPPIDLFEFNWNQLKNKIDLLICGDRDQFCSADILADEAKKMNSVLEVIQGADHFYGGKEKELMEILHKFMLKKT